MINWDDSVTAKCRWSDEAEAAFLKPKILWEDSVSDYQGHARFFGWTGAAVVFYEWTYGSCSGCDAWEGEFEGKDGSERLAAKMRGEAVYFDTLEVLRNFAEPIILRGRTDWNTYTREEVEQARPVWEKFIKEAEELLSD